MESSTRFPVQPLPESVLIFERSNQDIVNQAVLEVSDRMLYDVEKLRRPVQHGPLDARLVGISRSCGVIGLLFADTGVRFRDCRVKRASAKPAVKD